MNTRIRLLNAPKKWGGGKDITSPTQKVVGMSPVQLVIDTHAMRA